MDRLACVFASMDHPKKKREKSPGARRRASAGCRADCNNLMILAIAGRCLWGGVAVDGAFL